MPVYCDESMCKSDLGKKIQRMRAERPDEWTMDEYIRDAEILTAERDKLRAELERLVAQNDKANAKNRELIGLAEKERERVKGIAEKLKLTQHDKDTFGPVFLQGWETCATLVISALSAGEGDKTK